MWTGGQWSLCVIVPLVTVTITSLAVFLAYFKKHYDELSQRILNVLYAKLAVLDIVNAILMSTEIIVKFLRPSFSSTVDILWQSTLYFRLFLFTTFLEISVCSLLRLYSSSLYMWASLNIAHTTYTIIQAFLLVLIQYLIVVNAGIENVETLEEWSNRLAGSAKVVIFPMVTIVFILQLVILLR